MEQRALDRQALAHPSRESGDRIVTPLAESRTRQRIVHTPFHTVDPV